MRRAARVRGSAEGGGGWLRVLLGSGGDTGLSGARWRDPTPNSLLKNHRTGWTSVERCTYFEIGRLEGRRVTGRGGSVVFIAIVVE